ncbi:MAG: FixH family protein [Cytophagales bacterium]|nr:FixH family protein [Cytophagales bacterium]
MNWGKGIIAAYAFFVVFILTMVFWAMRQDVSLVEKDYYQEEIRYQDQIERIRNANKEENRLEWKYDADSRQLTLKYAKKHHTQGLSGELKLFRPDNAKADILFVMDGSSAEQVLELKKLKAGLWKIKAKWKSNDEEYYKEGSLFL